MRVDYIKANPTENKTLLVRSEVERQLQPKVAAMMMGQDPDSEQVGFIEPATMEGAVFRLQMMGGEFCGNATISAASLAAQEAGLESGKSMCIPIEVSGADEIIECTVSRNGELYTGNAAMPLPEKTVKSIRSCGNISCELMDIVTPGMVHMILREENAPGNYREFAEAAIKQWAAEIDSEGVGLILFDMERCEITPLVYVKPTDSLFWERGCGSGTAAAGVYASINSGASIAIPVKQPGGIIIAETEYDFGEDRVTKLSITGNVEFEMEGAMEVDI